MIPQLIEHQSDWCYNHHEKSIQPPKWLQWERLTPTSVSRDKEQLELTYIAGGGSTLVQPLGKPPGSVYENRPQITPHSILGRNVCQKISPRMLIAPLLVKTKNGKRHKCLSTVDWINKLRCIHTIEYYVEIKTTTQCNPTDTSYKDYAKREKLDNNEHCSCMIPFTCSLKTGKSNQWR